MSQNEVVESPYDAVAIERDVRVPMRDGITLSTDLYFPAGNDGRSPGAFPALIQRVGYGKSGAARVEEAAALARAGYVVVMQDVRGRFTSEGTFYPYINDCDDGFDTAEWVRRQPWCDGKLGVFGRSYTGGTAHSLALTAPEGLAAIFVVTAGSSYYKDAAYLGGAPQLLHNLGWVLGHAADEYEDDPEHPVTRQMNQGFESYIANLRAHPRAHLDLLACKPDFATFYQDWLERGTYDAYWQQQGYGLEGHYDDFPAVPVFYMSGWFDLFLRGTLRNYEALSSRQGRGRVRLVVGPWTHVGGMAGGFPEQIDYGPEYEPLVATEPKIRWFDYWLKGSDTGLVDEPPVKIFVMGGGGGRKTVDGKLLHGGRWRAEATWPPAGVRMMPYFLYGGGALGTTPAADSPPSEYVYDPNDPVPTIGGNMTHGRDLVPVGAARQQGSTHYAHCNDDGFLADRDDVLVFETPPLEEALEVTGPVTVRLWAASSAVDTDFTAKLVDVYPPSADWPAGFALNLADGVIRARYRHSLERPELLEPGRIYEFEIDLASTSNLFARGHRIRLDVSSSNFPRIAVNSNTGERVNFDTHIIPARNCIYHDSGHPSQLLLPVITVPR